jgi:DUF1680 family protein
VNDGYIEITKEWSNADNITIDFDMRTEVLHPQPYGTQILMNKVIWGANTVIPTFDKEDPVAKNHVALRRGPLMLAQDSRLGYNVDDAVSIVSKEGFTEAIVLEEAVGFNTVINAKIPLSDGTYMTVVDYASAGKLWTKESKMAVWVLVES